MKGVSIVQPKDWIPDNGPDEVIEILHEVYAEAEAVWGSTDHDINYVSIFTCNDIWFNRICTQTNTES